MRLLLKMPPRVVCCSSGQAPSKCASPSQCQCGTRAAGQGSRQGAPAATRAASGRAAQRRRRERLGRCEPALRRRRLVPRANSRNGTREAIVCTSALGGAGGTAAAMLENSGGHRPGSGAAACAARRRSPHSGAFRGAFSAACLALPRRASVAVDGAFRTSCRPSICCAARCRGRAALPAQCARPLAPRQTSARVRRRPGPRREGLEAADTGHRAAAHQARCARCSVVSVLGHRGPRSIDLGGLVGDNG